MRTCANCGASNADELVNCGSCGKPLKDITGTWPAQPQPEPRVSIVYPPMDRQDESLISIAINIRRIFILLLYVVFVMVITYLYGLWVDAFDPEFETSRAVSSLVGILVALVGVATLYFAVLKKKLSAES